jgi:hypothetical protein
MDMHMEGNMTNDDKLKEYNRLYGVKKTLVHEQAYELAILKGALKAKINKRCVRKRVGDVPKGESSVITLSLAQGKAYDIICDNIPNYPGGILESTLTKIGIRQSTIQALKTRKLIQIDDKRVKLYRLEETPEEIMQKNGVGRIMISMGVK